jgi:hypothetical protein
MRLKLIASRNEWPPNGLDKTDQINQKKREGTNYKYKSKKENMTTDPTVNEMRILWTLTNFKTLMKLPISRKNSTYQN